MSSDDDGNGIKSHSSYQKENIMQSDTGLPSDMDGDSVTWRACNFDEGIFQTDSMGDHYSVSAYEHFRNCIICIDEKN